MAEFTQEDGYEMTWAVNVMAPFLLTSLLLDNIRAGNKPRIINVSSVSQTEGGECLLQREVTLCSSV